MLTCPYHGWSFNTAGGLISVKDHANGAYPAAFEEQPHGLTPIARLANYKGFLFGSLNADVPALEDHLAAALPPIDMLADQAPDGWEVVAGSADYTYHGNWKLQVENGVDGYHFDVVHRTFVGVVQRRARSGSDEVQSLDAERLDAPTNATGCYDLGNGHTLLWTDYPNPQVRPSYAQREALCAQYGEAQARWMVERLRNLLLYPNVFLMDQISAQIRVIIPLAVDKTLVSTYCLAPVGEAPETRAHRLRQYEDFFNASGVGTPDDLAAFEACQRGFNGHQVRWQQGYGAWYRPGRLGRRCRSPLSRTATDRQQRQLSGRDHFSGPVSTLAGPHGPGPGNYTRKRPCRLTYWSAALGCCLTKPPVWTSAVGRTGWPCMPTMRNTGYRPGLMPADPRNDPQTELSLIYYNSKAGLERPGLADRVGPVARPPSPWTGPVT